MKFNFENHLGRVERLVAALDIDGKPARAVTLVRDYDTTVEDLWDAVTNSERLPRWFLPVSGELRLGGRFQLEGNAGGVITACDSPSHLALTWEFGEDTSWVQVGLSDQGSGRARLRLTHTALVSDHWNTYGAGATGVGWELGIVGLAMHIEQPAEPMPSEQDLAASPEGKAFVTRSSEGWGLAAIEGGADEELALAAVKQTTAFYTGESAESA